MQQRLHVSSRHDVKDYMKEAKAEIRTGQRVSVVQERRERKRNARQQKREEKAKTHAQKAADEGEGDDEDEKSGGLQDQDKEKDSDARHNVLAVSNNNLLRVRLVLMSGPSRIVYERCLPT